MPTRGKRVPVAFLGAARPKVWISDRQASPVCMTRGGHAQAHQVCLAHLMTGGFRTVWGAECYGDIRSIVSTGRCNGQSSLQAIGAALSPAPAAFLATDAVLTPV